jgi:hypothetical protein
VTVGGLTVTVIGGGAKDGVALPLRSTRKPVGFGELPSLVTTKSSVFTPATNPLVIVKGVQLENPNELGPTVTPFNLMLAELSAANCPVKTAVDALKPVRSKVVR